VTSTTVAINSTRVATNTAAIGRVMNDAMSLMCMAITVCMKRVRARPRLRSSIARLSSNSIDGLEGLTSELQELQRFLNSEVQRVQGEIESALAGIKIIIETIAPWKSSPVSLAPPTSARAIRVGPGSK
jgi:hypothetical protein